MILTYKSCCSRLMAINNSNLPLRSVHENDKLVGPNFIDWYRNLRIVLKLENKLYVLEQPIPETPSPSTTWFERDAHQKHYDDALEVSC